MESYAYVLTDDLCEWLVDKNPKKRTWNDVLGGLTTNGISLLASAIYFIKSNDETFSVDGLRYYSSMNLESLEKLAKESMGA